MEKLLTVSVAAYNGAATLQKALESCLVADESLQALLDVIIIDDGSTDGTAALAQAFVQAHPGSFRLVSKVNGGYGSTLNTAVELASGRYFRTLDCDDWFDTNALQSPFCAACKTARRMRYTPTTAPCRKTAAERPLMSAANLIQTVCMLWVKCSRPHLICAWRCTR